MGTGLWAGSCSVVFSQDVLRAAMRDVAKEEKAAGDPFVVRCSVHSFIVTFGRAWAGNGRRMCIEFSCQMPTISLCVSFLSNLLKSHLRMDSNCKHSRMTKLRW